MLEVYMYVIHFGADLKYTSSTRTAQKPSSESREMRQLYLYTPEYN